MSMLSSSPAALTALVAFGLVSSPVTGCKRHPPAPAPAPSALVSALPSALATADDGGEGAPAPAQCRLLPGFGLTLDAEAPAAGKAGPLAASERDENDDALLPFGVDIGAAVATPGGFAVAGIRGAGLAFVARVEPSSAARVDLGELHGDAETPAIALAGDDVLVALRGTDAAGFTLKLGRIARGAGSVEWDFELSKLGKTVTGVSLVASAGRGLLVYQGEDKHGSSQLMLAPIAVAALKEPVQAKPLDARDAEMPRLTTRPGGYWLSWVRTLPDAKTPAKKPSGEPVQDPEERELLDMGQRVVEVAKLDEQGKQLGSALRIGEPRRQVLLFDVAPLASGGLLVAARSDSAAPGAEGGALVLSEVGADGSVREERLDDDEIGAGAPTLLVDADAKRPGPWLAVSSPSDATRLGLARGGRTELKSDALLGRAQVIAVSGGHFLVQRARGRSVTLEALECSWPSDNGAEKK